MSFNVSVSKLGKKAYLDCARDWNTNILQEFLRINKYLLPKHNIPHTCTLFIEKKKKEEGYKRIGAITTSLPHFFFFPASKKGFSGWILIS